MLAQVAIFTHLLSIPTWVRVVVLPVVVPRPVAPSELDPAVHNVLSDLLTNDKLVVVVAVESMSPLDPYTFDQLVPEPI